MPVLRLTVNLEMDGEIVPGYPKIKRISVDESQSFRMEKADDGDATTFTALPTAQLGEVQALIVEADQQITHRLDGQTDAGVVMNAGGILIIFNADLDASATTNITSNNNTGSTANIKGIVGGT